MSEGKRIRRTPEQIAADLDVQIEKLKDSILELENKKGGGGNEQLGVSHAQRQAIETGGISGRDAPSADPVDCEEEYRPQIGGSLNNNYSVWHAC